MPTTFSGRRLPRAMSAIGMAEVLDATTHVSGMMGSICSRTRCLTPSSSNTASMTMSARAKCLFQDPSMPSWRPWTLDVATLKSWLVMRRFLSFSRRPDAMYPSPREAPAASLSLRRTVNPFSHDTWPMPAPMSPAPRTPSVLTRRGGSPKRLFLAAVEASKSPMSAALTLVCASRLNAAASAVRCVRLGWPTLLLSTSRIS
mmetsp:Transcript_7871/g.26788  ORF Transcript_7871/g.26788 Transcript_7871/m.26788 type:complete len:202 (-) Transcript_7871:447-1052(-)